MLLDHVVLKASAEADVGKFVHASSACAYPTSLQASVEDRLLLKESDANFDEVGALPGTQNEHDGVTFGEHEQPVVGVHADAMVFTLTAGRLVWCSW